MHCTKSTNYDLKKIQEETKIALKSNKVSNLPFVYPELFKKKTFEIRSKTEGVLIFCRNIDVISAHKQTVRLCLIKTVFRGEAQTEYYAVAV